MRLENFLDHIKRRECILLSIVFIASLLFLPDKILLEKTNTDWDLGLPLFVVTFILGYISAKNFYRKHSFYHLDPFYLRAWPGVICGIAALPICLAFRPPVAHIAFLMFCFGAGPVTAFIVFRMRINKAKK